MDLDKGKLKAELNKQKILPIEIRAKKISSRAKVYSLQLQFDFLYIVVAMTKTINSFLIYRSVLS